jgi:2-iminoacetate synthase
MSIFPVLQQYPESRIAESLKRLTQKQVEQALSKEVLSENDFLALLSPLAAPYLETMAQKAQDMTRRHFGNVIFIFTPLYISNYCENQCVYCSFGAHQSIPRSQLTLEAIEKEAAAITAQGIRHILLLTGEARKKASPEYIGQAAAILKKSFSAIAIEVYAMTQAEYAYLIDKGVDSLTLYQETYDPDVYKTMHLSGPKTDYRFRLDAPESALKANMRAVTLGPLFGLADPLAEAFRTGLHLRYLQNKYPEAEIGLSLPRMRPLVSDFTVPHVLDDKRFVQTLLAFRLFAPTAGITVSTRENESFRNSILPLGVTKMSAGVSTAVGGHTHEDETGQFEIADTRSVQQLSDDLRTRGYQPVLHDWNYQLF